MKLQSFNQRDFFWNIWGQETRKLSPSVYQVRNNQEKLEQVLQTKLSLNENEFFFFNEKGKNNYGCGCGHDDRERGNLNSLNN